MSLPTSGFGSSRRFRAPSEGSHSSPRLIPSTSDPGDGNSDLLNYGSQRGRSNSQASFPHPSTAREPTRSSVHLSYRGNPQGLIHDQLPRSGCTNFLPAHVETTSYARSVREDTAELASYALSDKASTRSASPPRHRSGQTSLETYFNMGSDSETPPIRHAEGLQHHIIQEVSEPVTPESSPPSDQAPGTSALTSLLKHSPTNSPPRQGGDGEEAGENDFAVDEDQDEADSDQRRLIITTNGVETTEPTERTSLLGKDTRYETHHPDWIRGEQDVERQDLKRQPAWPKLRNTLMWPRDRGIDVARTVLNPKAWDRKAIWRAGVVAPVGYLPAVTLGTLLNILDALSYGKPRPRCD